MAPWLNTSASSPVRRKARRSAIAPRAWRARSSSARSSLQARGDGLHPARHGPDEGRGLRRRGARVHRDPPHHERRELAAADARLDTTSGARGAAPRGATARGPLSARATYLPLSNLKDTLTLVRYALILPFCTCTSCCTTSAMRRSRRLFAA